MSTVFGVDNLCINWAVGTSEFHPFEKGVASPITFTIYYSLLLRKIF